MPSGKMVRSMGLGLRPLGVGIGALLGAEDDGASVRAGAIVVEFLEKAIAYDIEFYTAATQYEREHGKGRKRRR